MTRLRAYKADLLILCGFLLLPLLLYGPVTLGGKTMLPVDNLFQWAPWSAAAAELGVETPQNSLLTDLIVENYPWKRFVKESLQDGEIPLWNPHLFAGAPFLATGQHSAYYPFSILYWIMPLAKAYGWFTVTQLWLAGALMYFFGRVLRMRRASAAIAGLIYQGSGFMLASAAVFPMVIGAAVWLPLLLACIEKVVSGQWLVDRENPSQSPISSPQSPIPTNPSSFLWVALGAVALGTQSLAGHPEITYYSLLVMALFAAWRIGAHSLRHRRAGGWWRAWIRPSAWLLGMVALGLLLGAIQLIPLFEVGAANFREGASSFTEVRSYAFPPRRVLTLALPNFFGNPAHHSYVDVFNGETVPVRQNYYGDPVASIDWGIKNYVEGGIYLGILPLLLAAAGVASWRGHKGARKRGDDETRERRSHILFFTLLSLVSLAFVFGTPLYAILFYGLPFVNQLHTPFRWVFPLSLCVAALAGFGMDYLAATRRDNETRRGQPGNVWASDKRAPWFVRPLFLWGRPSLVTGLAGAAFWGGVGLLLALWGTRLAYPAIEPTIERLFMTLAKASFAFPSARAFYSYEFRQFLILGLMLVAAGATLRVSRCPIFVRGKPIYLFMVAVTITLDLFIANWGFNAAVDPALLHYKPELVQWLEAQPGHWRLTSFAPHSDKPFNANSGWLYDLEDVRGYDSMIAKQYVDYMAAIEPQNELKFNRVQPIVNWQSLNSPLLDVLNVRYVITAEAIDLPKYRLAWTGEGLRVYQNLSVAPRAYTLPLSSTAVVGDPLAAMTELDPRQYVVVEENDLRLKIDDGRFNLQSLIANPQSSTPAPYAPATIDEYRRIQVTVSAAVDEPSWLILNDSYFPGWKGWIRPFAAGEAQETEVEVVRVNGNFRGVLLEPGQWTVRFRYSPASFQLGGLASAMGVIVLAFGLLLWGWRRVVQPDAPLTVTRSIAKNSAVPMALNLFNKFIDFVFAAFYLRFLGPADAGSYAYAIATAGFFDIISNFGLNILLIRDVSQEREQASRYLLNTSLLRLGTGAVGALPIIIYLVAVSQGANPPTPAEISAVLLIMVGMVFSGMAQGVTGLFYVHEKAETPAAMTTVTTILKVAFGVAVLLLGFGFVGLAAVSIVVNIITLVALAGLAFRNFHLPGPWRVDWHLQRAMVSKGYPLMLIHLLQTVFISIDVVILRSMLANGQEVVGWYNSAYKWFNALQIVPSFFTLALFPVISRAIKEAMADAQRMYRLSLKLMLLLALPVAVLTSFTAVYLVQIVAGDEFLPHGAIALQIVIWSIPFGWLNSVTNYVLIALGLERMQPRAFALAVGFNIVTNLIFIPRFSYVAASVTTILSEVVLLVVFDFYLRRRMAGINWLAFLGRPFLLTGVMVGLIFLGSQIHIVVGLALGALAYPVGLWLLRIIGEEERVVLRQILPRTMISRLKI